MGKECKNPKCTKRLVIEQLVKALENFTEMYVNSVNSGDWGNWDPETDEEVIMARAALEAGNAVLGVKG